MRKAIACLAAALIFGAGFPHAAAFKPAETVAARGECVVEVTSRRFLHEKNADEPLPMASTTKILTAIIAIEDLDMDAAVEIPKAAEGVEGSSVYLRAGDKYSVRDLLYGLMLRSGNDCAVSLALFHSGSVGAFAAEMNRRAALMGAENSRFANPHGLPAEGHYTTARDLALIAAYAMQNETFREIVSCKFYEPCGWKNKNKMLWDYEGAIGVKTGFTAQAGRCLVTAAEKDGMQLVSVVLNCAPMYERSAALLSEAFGAYRMIPIVDVSAGWEGYAVRGSFSYPLKKTELRGLRFATELIDPAPTEGGQLAGQLQISLENDLIFSENLYIME